MGGGVPEAGAGGEPGASTVSPAEADPLVSNGLGSPFCKGAVAAQELSSRARANCETSGFVAASSPTGNYGLDVHIDTGFLGVSEGGLLSIVQDLFVTPLWMALVWVVHALVVMLEWCFTIDVLDSSAVQLGSDLRQMQASITDPWLAGVLAVAAVLTAYNGLVRRRVSEALGHALLAAGMMAAGLWVILDPTGTVGALGNWANRASLGTLAASARGSPSEGGGALADSMGALFASTVEAPWCYMEFGDVGWCRNPARLDPRLRAAALKIAGTEMAQAACSRGGPPVSPCPSSDGGSASALERSAQLLRAARSNGAIFLALPANGPERNSINDEGSLLHVMCQSSQATRCHGPMAAQAEFRTNGGTWKRIGGLLLIVGGVLGMLLLFGFVALRLLGAAIFSLLYLLLAPAAVLAPALGDGGRSAFRRWAARLLGAVVAKLLFAFLLGVLLAVLSILAALEAIGWWTQWLLMSAFWWGAYGHRHHALGIAGWHAGGPQATGPLSLLRRGSERLRPSRRRLGGAARGLANRLPEVPSAEERAVRLARAARRQAGALLHEQAQRTLGYERREAGERMARQPQLRAQLSASQAQLARIRRAHADALARGDTRRAARLAHRARRVELEISTGQQALAAARAAGSPRAADELRRRVDLLDAQARLPAGRVGGERRNYAAMSALAGYGREEYEALDPQRQRVARMEIDRELAMRNVVRPAAAQVAEAGLARTRGRDARRAERELQRQVEQRVGEAGHGMPVSQLSDRIASWSRAGRASLPPRESAVMRDAREVAARRKRQLGLDRP